jgi:hypothetical protein
MRFRFLLATLITILAHETATAAEPERKAIELRSDHLVTSLPLAESAGGVYYIRLAAQVDKNGEGKGTLELDPNAPTYDELGWPTIGGSLLFVKLECNLKLVKKKTIRLRQSGRVAAPLVDVEWALLEITGPKITSPLFLAMEDKVWGQWARLLVHDKEGKVKYAVHLAAPPPLEPCHPGCFPAGTPIRTPGGTQTIERLREGDTVTTVDAKGATTSAKVQAVFATSNRLIEVRTDEGNLVTTTTQPLALADGGLRAAGELKAGDQIFRWDGRARRAVAVRSVTPKDREEQVYNLILGDPAVFIADGFLARSKPPAPAVDFTKP